MMKILFVCHGNICRSPMAEAIFQKYLQEKNLFHLYGVDSAGTHGTYVGQKPDDRTVKILESHNINGYEHKARKIAFEDFDTYDLILVMDWENLQYVQNMKNTIAEIKKREPRTEVELIRNYDTAGGSEVPDPYYGNINNFENVYAILKRSIDNFFTTT
jgi:protein-tyrosine phosphatase